MEFKYKDTANRSEMLFPNGNSLTLNYPRVKDDSFLFNYYLKNVNGTTKVIPEWLSNYDDVVGMMEGGLPHLFFPVLLNYLYEMDESRLNTYKEVVSLYDAKNFVQLENQFKHYNIWEIDTYRKWVELYTKVVDELEEMKLWLVFNS